MTQLAERTKLIKPSVTLAIAAKAGKLRSEGVDIVNFSISPIARGPIPIDKNMITMGLARRNERSEFLGPFAPLVPFIHRPQQLTPRTQYIIQLPMLKTDISHHAPVRNPMYHPRHGGKILETKK